MADHDETKAPGTMARIDDDDVEGHSAGPAGSRPRRRDQRRIDEDDVEGHRGRHREPTAARTTRRDARRAARIDDDEDDVEGHFGYVKGPSSRGE